MNEIKVFTHEQFGNLRIVMRDGEPWFVAADVCKALEHSNVTVALDRLDDDEKAKLNLGLQGGATGCVNEPGLYTLVLGSRKREAKVFKRWVTHDVLPSIRKHGAYMTPETIEKVLYNPDFIIRLASDLKSEQQKNIALTNENKLLAHEHCQWDLRKFIVSAVRTYAGKQKCSPGYRMGYAWQDYKKNLLYKCSINLNLRKHYADIYSVNKQKVRLMDLITDEELPVAADMIVSMCREKDIDISKLLEKVSDIFPLGNG